MLCHKDFGPCMKPMRARTLDMSTTCRWCTRGHDVDANGGFMMVTAAICIGATSPTITGGRRTCAARYRFAALLGDDGIAGADQAGCGRASRARSGLRSGDEAADRMLAHLCGAPMPLVFRCRIGHHHCGRDFSPSPCSAPGTGGDRLPCARRHVDGVAERVQWEGMS